MFAPKVDPQICSLQNYLLSLDYQLTQHIANYPFFLVETLQLLIMLTLYQKFVPTRMSQLERLVHTEYL